MCNYLKRKHFSSDYFNILFGSEFVYFIKLNESHEFRLTYMTIYDNSWT
jgi:hypothetical protein